MPDLENREAAFEAKFVYDQNLRFKVEAKCCRLLGLWAAEKMDIGNEGEMELYSNEVAAHNLEEIGFDNVKQKLLTDFKNKGVEISEEEIDNKLSQCMIEAKTTVMATEGDK